MLSIDTRLRARGFRYEAIRSPVIREAVNVSRSLREAERARAAETIAVAISASRRIRESIRESEQRRLEAIVREVNEILPTIRRKAF